MRVLARELHSKWSLSRSCVRSSGKQLPTLWQQEFCGSVMHFWAWIVLVPEPAVPVSVGAVDSVTAPELLRQAVGLAAFDVG